MQQIASPTAAMPEGQALYDSALHHWSLLEPYFPEDFANELLPIYRALLLESAPPSDSNTRPKRAVTAARPRRRQSLIS